jgi:hypothetical protein
VCRGIGTNTKRSEKIAVPNNPSRYAFDAQYLRIAEPHSPRRACGKNRLPLLVCGRSQASSRFESCVNLFADRQAGFRFGIHLAGGNAPKTNIDYVIAFNGQH